MTSEIMPRPYCAAAPGELQVLGDARPWCPAPAGGEAAPSPAWRPGRGPSRRHRRRRRRSACAASSRSVISAVPANCSFTGPIRIATLPWYLSSPRSSVSSAPGRHAATCGMLSKNCQTLSTGCGDLEVVLDQHRASLRAGRRAGSCSNALPAAGTAEVVGRRRRARTGGWTRRRAPSSRRPGRAAGRAAAAVAAAGAGGRIGPTSAPAARSCTSSARMATAISRCEVWPRSSPTGTRTRSSRSRGHAAVGQVAEHRLAPRREATRPR